MEELPQTQTQSQSSQPLSCQELRIPWGRLVACSPLYTSVDLFEMEYSLGRAPSCDIFLNMTSISKVHFKLFKDDAGMVFIEDLSKNGTFVNSVRVGNSNTFMIGQQDEIAISDAKAKAFIFHFNSANAYEPVFLPEQLRRKYLSSRMLGRGGCGEVRLCYEKATSKRFAVKKIVKSGLSTIEVGMINHPNKIKTEIEIMSVSKHPFIIDFYEVEETEREVYMVLEYMKGGELTQRVLSGIAFPEAEVKFVFYQILMGVQFLHGSGITHRDLKPENILLSSDRPYPHAKIADFGLSKIMDEQSMMETICGTYHYVAPEVLSHQIKYNKKVDVWSLGVILFYMLSKDLPFRASSQDALIKRILTGEINWDQKIWRRVSYQAQDLVKRMLMVSPQRRLSTSDVLKHPWIEKDAAMKYKIEQLLSANSDEEPLPKRLRLEQYTDL